MLKAIVLQLTAESTELEWSEVTFKPVACESEDAEQEIYERRMGMRTYLKELKMNLSRKSKPETSAKAKKGKKGKKNI